MKTWRSGLIFLLHISFSAIALANSKDEDMKKVRIARSFITGLVGDSLALGGHYEYDARKIKAQVGRYTNFLPPGESNNGIGWGTANYHPGKQAGDLTDAGEIAIMLLECIEKEGRKNYSFDKYAMYWFKQIKEGYGSCNFQSVGRDAKSCPPGLNPGYINGGSRRTLQALAMYPNNAVVVGERRKALAADVNCLVAATHFLPLFFISNDDEFLVKESVATVYISHRNPDPVAAAEFLSRAIYLMIHRDMDLQEALEASAAKSTYPLIQKWLRDAIAKVHEATSPSSALRQEEFVDDIAITSMARLWDVGKTEPIKIGKASPTEGALPASLYFALKYRDDVEEALIANAGCGGDSAARGMVIGMLLGAQKSFRGFDAAPGHRWIVGLNAYDRVMKLVDSIAEAEKFEAEAEL